MASSLSSIRHRAEVVAATSECWLGDQLCAEGGTSKQRPGTSRDVFCYRRGCPRVREAGELNEPLRRALLRARLREDDVAARLGVDPKTVRRWLNGRVPYANNRAALANLVGADEADLWPDASGPLAARVRPEELEAVYPHRWSIPREVWTRFFEGGRTRDRHPRLQCPVPRRGGGHPAHPADKGRAGVTVRIALGDPDSPRVAERGDVEDIDEDIARRGPQCPRASQSARSGREHRDPATSNSVVWLDLQSRRSTLRQPACLWHVRLSHSSLLVSQTRARRHNCRIYR